MNAAISANIPTAAVPKKVFATTSTKKPAAADNKKSESDAHHQAMPTVALHKAERQEGKQQHQLQTDAPRKPPTAAELAHRKRIEELDAAIDGVRKQIDTLRGDFSQGTARPGASKQEQSERALLVEQLRTLRTQQKQTIDQKRSLIDQSQATRDAIKERSAKAAQQREKLAFRSPDEIDRKVAELEKMLEGGGLKLVQEKSTATEISRLRKVRRELVALSEAPLHEMAASRAKLDLLQAQITAANAKLDTLRSEMETLNARLAVIDGQQRDSVLKESEKRTKIDSLRKDIEALFEKRRRAIDERNVERDAQRAVFMRNQAARAEQQRRFAIEEEIDGLEKQLSRLLSGRSSDSSADRLYSECENLLAFYGQKTGTSADFKKIPMPILAALADLGFVPPKDSASNESLLQSLRSRQASLQVGRDASRSKQQERAADLERKIAELEKSLEDPNARVTAAALRREEKQQAKQQEKEGEKVPEEDEKTKQEDDA